MSTGDEDKLAEQDQIVELDPEILANITEAIFDRFNIGETEKIEALLASDTTLDPKGSICVGLVPSGRAGYLSIVGEWKPGANHRYWGPTGDSRTPYRGSNKWSVIVSIHETDRYGLPGRIVKVCQYPGSPIYIQGNGALGVIVMARMNDDDFKDNENNPANPMRASGLY